MATSTHIATDQDWHAGTTTYWFKLSGADYGTGWEFDEGEEYGVVEGSEGSAILDGDGCPLTEGDPLTVAVRNSVTVTDQMREDG